ncbi:MAG: sensor histidine kinase [Streptosporangiaceae bacterium]
MKPSRWPLRRRLALSLAGMFVLGYVLITAGWFFSAEAWTAGGAQACYPATPFGSSSCEFANWNLGVRVVVFVLVVLILAAAAWSWWFLAGRLLRPLLTAAQTVRRVSPQNLGQRVGLTGPAGELKELADALDETLDRLAAGYESQRRFASNASHELRTPLAVQRLLAEVAMDAPEAGQDLRRLGAQLLRVNERSERLIEGLLVRAERDRGLPGKVPVRLDELAASVLDAHLEMANKHGVSLRRCLAGRLVPGDPLLLDRLIGNLVANAIGYNYPGGWVEVAVAGQPGPALTVRNSGQDVPAEAVSSLFEPFQRLTPDRADCRGGAGLGLSIVRSITAAHGGTVRARPGAEGGLTIEIELPPHP